MNIFLVNKVCAPKILISIVMGTLYESVIRPMLFKQDAEDAHERAISGLKLLCKLSPVVSVMEKYNRTQSSQPIELFGLNFPNPIGLAAGFDKNAECWTAMQALGFGHVEIGTVTAHEQPGNQRPRMFRIPEHEALINRMGFNNDGAEAVAKRLSKGPDSKKRKIPLGINIGKSKIVNIENAAEDYLMSFNHLADYADYFTVNVSSPNTPDLRKLQGKDYLFDLLNILQTANSDRAKKMGKPRIPMLLKIAPDLTYKEIDQILEVLFRVKFDAIIATNTMLARPAAIGENTETGGLSGRPVAGRATQVVNYIHRSTEGKLPIVGVGGIMDEKIAGQFFDAGASLIQLYSGMVFRGPFFPKRVAQAVSWRHGEWV